MPGRYSGDGMEGQGKGEVYAISQKGEPHIKGMSTPFRGQKQSGVPGVALKGHAGDIIQWSLRVR